MFQLLIHWRTFLSAKVNVELKQTTTITVEYLFRSIDVILGAHFYFCSFDQLVQTQKCEMKRACERSKEEKRTEKKSSLPDKDRLENTPKLFWWVRRIGWNKPSNKYSILIIDQETISEFLLIKLIEIENARSSMGNGHQMMKMTKPGKGREFLFLRVYRLLRKSICDHWSFYRCFILNKSTFKFKQQDDHFKWLIRYVQINSFEVTSVENVFISLVFFWDSISFFKSIFC